MITEGMMSMLVGMLAFGGVVWLVLTVVIVASMLAESYDREQLQ